MDVDHKELTFFRQEEAKLQSTKDQLDACSALTAQTLDILNGFEAKLTHLATTIDKVQQQTTSLTYAQKNTTSAIAATDELIGHLDVANEDETNQPHRDIHFDYVDYLSWVQRITEATLYFDRLPAKDFIGADRCQKKLKDLSSKVCHDCATELERLLGPYDNKPVDLLKTPFPFSDDFEVIPAGALERMALVAERLDSSGNRHLIFEQLKEPRSGSLKLTLKELIHNPDIAALHNLYVGDKPHEREVGRYTPGSHKAIFFMEVFLHLLEMEKKCIFTIFSKTQLRPLEVQEKCVLEVCNLPLEYFLKKQHEWVKEKGGNRMLIMLDMLTHLDRLRSRYVDCFEEPTAERIRAWYHELWTAGAQAMCEYIEYVAEFNPLTKQQKRMKDGAVYNLTIETLNVIHRMYAYTTTINSRYVGSTLHRLVPRRGVVFGGEVQNVRNSVSISHQGSIQSTIHRRSTLIKKDEMPAAGSSPPVTSLTMWILDALKKNLETRAQHFKREARAAVFLMNNLHFVAADVKKRQFHVVEGFENQYKLLVKHQVERYWTSSWSKALKFINASDSIDLKARATRDGGKSMKQEKKKIKAKCTGFNTLFLEQHAKQKDFLVADSQLKAILSQRNLSILDDYRKFCDIWRGVEFSSDQGKYLKYTEEDLADKLAEFFVC